MSKTMTDAPDGGAGTALLGTTRYLPGSEIAPAGTVIVAVTPYVPTNVSLAVSPGTITSVLSISKDQASL